MIFFQQIFETLEVHSSIWTLISSVTSKKNSLSPFGHSVVPSPSTSTPWSCVKQQKGDGKKSGSISKDPWCISAIAFSNLRKRSLTRLQFSMRAHLRCLDWSFRKMFGTVFKLRREWRHIFLFFEYYLPF